MDEINKMMDESFDELSDMLAAKQVIHKIGDDTPDVLEIKDDVVEATIAETPNVKFQDVNYWHVHYRGMNDKKKIIKQLQLEITNQIFTTNAGAGRRFHFFFIDLATVHPGNINNVVLPVQLLQKMKNFIYSFEFEAPVEKQVKSNIVLYDTTVNDDHETFTRFKVDLFLEIRSLIPAKTGEKIPLAKIEEKQGMTTAKEAPPKYDNGGALEGEGSPIYKHTETRTTQNSVKCCIIL